MRTQTSLLASLLVLVACGGGNTEAPPVVAPDKPAEEVVVPPPTTVADGPTAKTTLTWTLETLANGGELSAAEIELRFAPEFLKMVPPAQLKTVFKELAAQLSPIKVIKEDGNGDTELTALLDTKAGGVRVVIGVNTKVPRQIETLLFQPAANEAPPKTYGDAVNILKEAGAEVMFSVSEIKKGVCTPYQNFNATGSLAIGSAFKLWVLAALDKKLAASKKENWDTVLKVEDALKTLPSGVMQNEAAGTEFTIREFATKMIAISDNTATDHIINYVTRGEVEKMLKTAGHGKPDRNIPFLTAGELFALKLAATDDELAAYKKAKVADKRKMLEALRKKEVKLEMAAGWAKPKLLDLEWFADGPDLCNVIAQIGKQAKWDPSAEVFKVLGTSPMLEASKEHWSPMWKYLGFKGGSEPGVINLTFVGQRKDDRWFVVAMTVNDSTKAVNEGSVANAARGVLGILGDE